MKEVLWNLFELLINIYEGFIVFHFVCSFLNFNIKNRKNKIVYISGSLGYTAVVTVINNLSAFEGILGLIYPILVFAFAVVFLEGGTAKKAFISLLAFSCIIMVNTTVTAALTTVTANHLESIYTKRNIYRFIMIVTVQLIVTYLYQMILKISAKDGVTFKLSEWILIFSVLGISIVIFILIHLVQIQTALTQNGIVFLLAAKTGMLIINVVSFFMITKLSTANMTETENKILKQQNEYQKLYAENIKNQYEEIHCIMHDVNQRYNVLLTLIENNQSYSAADFIKTVIKDNDKFEMSIDTGNDVVNAVLNSKLISARKNGINAVYSISNDFSGIDDIDWCSLLGNLLDNAIEACCRCKSDTYIYVQIRTNNDKVEITVKNTLSSVARDENNNLITSKENTSEHGYGIKIIKNIIKKYRGEYDFYIEDNNFCNSITLYKRS